MLRILRRLLQMLGLTLLYTLITTVVVALWHHIVETPQTLDSVLPGESRIYDWKQGNIFYKVLGPLDAPPLVLLHAPGVAASSFEMRKLIGPLAQRYRVYAPDLLGFGLSDRPYQHYSAETFITLCHDFLAEVVKEPATLLASGLSCNYAITVASRSPRLCTNLVLISPVAMFATNQEYKQISLLRDLITSSAASLLVYPLLCTRPALRSAIKRRHGDYTTSELDHLYATTHQLGAHHAPMAYVAGKLSHDVTDQMETLQQPTLIIWGTQELNDARALPGHLSTSSEIVLLRDSGTSVHEERPKIVVATIEEWDKANKVALAVAKNPTIETSEAAMSRPTSKKEDVDKLASKPGIETKETARNSSSSAIEDELDESPTIEAYCARCKKKVPMQDAHEVTMKNGRPALRGTCPVCGTGLFRVGRG